MRTNLFWIALLILSSLSVAGCQSAPPQPLFRPLEANSYGYSERQIDDHHWEVTYTGPRYPSSYSDDKSRSQEAEAARTQAYELALWRAAQISLEQKEPRFAVISERGDLDRSSLSDRNSPYPYFPYGYRHTGFWGWWPYYENYSTEAFHDAVVTLTIDLNPVSGAQTFDAKETADRLEAQYASKTWQPN